MTNLALATPQDDDWAPRFLQAYATQTALANPTAAAKHAGIHINAVKTRLLNDPDFRDQYHQATEQISDAIEQVFTDHMLNGWEEPITQHGAIVGTIRKWDHKHMLAYLERQRPQKWSLTQQEQGETPQTFRFELGEKTGG